MSILLRELMRLPELQHIRQELEDGCCGAVITGLSPVHRVQLSAALAQADQEVDGILKEGREKARVEYNRVLANAQAEAQKEVAKAHASIARDREETMRSIKTEVGQLVALTAGKLLEEDVSDEVCERLYEEMMAQAGERE